jgi:GAF domain-containing protein/HAMP domain-containing protein
LQPDILSLEASQQKPVLEAMAAAYPDMYLVHTIGLDGMNIARSDGGKPTNYQDRTYFQGAMTGKPINIQILIGRTSGNPAVVMAVPIRDAAGQIIGVASFASELDTISNEIISVTVGKSGYAYLVDEKNQVVAHPDPAFTHEKLTDLSAYPPVTILRSGVRGPVAFDDENGIRWRAYVSQLDNGWGIIVQQPEKELLDQLLTFRRISNIAILIGSFLMLILAWLTISRALRPVSAITNTAIAIAKGELDRSVEVQSDDEIGALADAFNHMTGQLREVVANLEQRVSERTAELQDASGQSEKHARELQIVSKVARAVSSEQDLEKLLPLITGVVNERFGFYHVGVFLLEERGEYAVLQAANSPGGQKMLQRGHRLRVGATSIVGTAAAQGEARIALDVGVDAVYFNNPDLPTTRSEIALPLKISGQTIGVLDVQSEEVGAFKEEDIAVLGILADQISIAIENARLFSQTREALSESQTVYQQYVKQDWARFAQTLKHHGYTYDGIKTSPLGENFSEPGTEGLTIPVKIRGLVVGYVVVRSTNPLRQWTQDEINLAQAAADRAGLTIDNVRLLTEAQRRAAKEQTIGEITSRIGSSINMSAIMQTAVEELGRALPGSEVVLQFREQGQ